MKDNFSSISALCFLYGSSILNILLICFDTKFLSRSPCSFDEEDTCKFSQSAVYRLPIIFYSPWKSVFILKVALKVV